MTLVPRESGKRGWTRTYILDRPRTPEVEWRIAARTVVHQRTAFPGSERGFDVTGSGVHERRSETARREGLVVERKPRSKMPALKP
jgi:hypothetical protein